jgi:hypothetical protein
VSAAVSLQAAPADSARPYAVDALSPRLVAGKSQPAADHRQAPAIRGRRGWNLAAPLRSFRPDASGLVTVDAEEVDRIELHILNVGPDTLAGYLWDGTRLGPLPIGASLDAARGVFTWQPGVGFVGRYHFVFEGTGPKGIRQDVLIVLHPKKSGRVGPQAAIDTPRSGQELVQPFTLTGWAIDLDDPDGPGIELVEVWASTLGQPRILLGTATYGSARSDVAELYGRTYRNSGLSAEVNGLAPGVYDLAVVARSRTAGGFVPAVVVRVTVH